MKTLMKVLMMLSLSVLAGLYSCDDNDTEPVELSTATDILTFSFPEETGPANINATNHTVAIEVENGTDLTNLTPSFTLSAGATSVPASGSSDDYSSEVSITVTAEDGETTQVWQVNVTEAALILSSEADILTFTIPDKATGNATIDNTDHTIAIEVIYGTDLTSLTPAFTISEGAISDPVSGTEGDYSSPFTISVQAEDGVTIQEWIVNVAKSAGNGTDILTFELAEQTSSATIIYADHTVDIEVVNGTDRSSLTPKFTLSIGATSVPVSETTGDYSSEVTIAVTAGNGVTTQDWKVNVSEAPGGLSNATDILTFTLPEQLIEAVIDPTSHKITVEVVSGTNPNNLTPTWTLSPGATSVPSSGTTSDYSNDFTITVTAEDGATTQDWTVFVNDYVDAETICSENLCAASEELKKNCIDFLNDCIKFQPVEQHYDCITIAVISCKL